MKLSLAWIFDHIDSDYKKFDIKSIVKLFNEKVAEIEDYEHVSIDLDNLTLAQVKEATQHFVSLYSPEWKKDIELPARDYVREDEWYLIKKEDNGFNWASSSELGAQKEMDLPALICPKEDLDGSWKKRIEKEDYIIDVDNKSITNRPDLWGHRGFAREFALILDLKLRPESEFLEKLKVEKAEKKLSGKNLTVEIQDNKKCKKLAGLYVQEIENSPSLLWMAVRLSKVDSRAINAIVDTTNYTMLDIGQPMHAFDAEQLNSSRCHPDTSTHLHSLPDFASSFVGHGSVTGHGERALSASRIHVSGSNQLIVRAAKKGEKLILLDGDEVELSKDDCVIATDKEVVSLAGIMGGQKSGVSSATKRVILESGIFDPTVIRLTSTRLKKRSEASARFEKSLDPNQNVDAIERFAKLFKDNGLGFEACDSILSVGREAEPISIELSHDLIEKRLGIKIDPELIVGRLKKIGFDVILESEIIPDLKVDSDKELVQINYKIKVPSNRASKDITIAEDIIEEVARIYGYYKIPYVVPEKVTVAHNIDEVLRIRKIKNYLSFGCRMMEIKTYPFYDESFIAKLDLKIENPIQVLNPVSQNWTTLVESLVPNMLKAIETNLYKADSIRFYELARVWKRNISEAEESKSIAGIIFEYKDKIDFYNAKDYLQGLFDMFNVDIHWKKIGSSGFVNPWYDRNLSADIFYKDERIGTAGLVDKKFFNKINDEGWAFVYELDAHFIINFESSDIKFKPLVKYPPVDLDISLLASLNISVEKIENLILDVDDLIKSVRLIDSFEKPEWVDKKSLTFRFKVLDETKTLHKEKIEEILRRVEERMESIGAEIR